MGVTAETNKETWRKFKLLTNWNKIKDILLSGLLTQIQKDAKRSDKKLHFFPLRATKKPVAKCKKLKRLRFKEPNAALKQWLLTLPVKSLRTLLITWLLITLKNVISFLIFNIWFQVFLIQLQQPCDNWNWQNCWGFCDAWCCSIWANCKKWT